ncbi:MULTISPECIES: cupin domain-containing protein [unclassified Rhodococcus (in: high G+C Gram-positive bacteria)]|uniref:cupin domain-containing protein n=1 Tax=unclassified Rhodococcus (in: high G+C Gram-positive bacteria) TaxID=192944 RepID=UPI00163A12CE|nr:MULTISPECIES: cupin domain-containing protein [unclassified Rhodococcus (in: high G+C Gram-positive bacteria)]MBC2644186.1 cupin domain-containing protein [Rhodococcus sp. 3A]MBC2891075.1 cupin domain-containing protein [Rhodococcus sp. 4CII]
MPSVTKTSASEQVSIEGLDVGMENFEGGYTVCFESHHADTDLAPAFRGLPDDRCQFSRWGYVVRGRVGFRFASHEETYSTGEAYYVPPGHTPIHYAGTELVEFSPTDQLGQALGVAMANLGVEVR